MSGAVMLTAMPASLQLWSTTALQSFAQQTATHDSGLFSDTTRGLQGSMAKFLRRRVSSEHSGPMQGAAPIKKAMAASRTGATRFLFLVLTALLWAAQYAHAGDVSASVSTLQQTSKIVPADNVSTSTITVTLKDSAGNPVSGKTVTLSQTGTSTISAASGPSNASGAVMFTVSSAIATTVTYTATDTTDGIVLTQRPTTTFIPSANASTVVASPTSVPADNTSNSTITVKIIDYSGNPVPGRLVSLTAASGSSTISPANTSTNASGVATFAVRDAAAESVTYTSRDVSDGFFVTQTATVTFVAAASATLSTILSSPKIVPADNITTSKITVTLKDSAGNPVSGKVVTLSAGSGSSTISAASGPSNASGVVIFTVRDAIAQSVTYTATDTTDGITITQKATVTFGPTAGASTVVASPTSVPADNITTSTITVTLRDGSGNPVFGKTVTLAAGSGSSTISAASGPSNASGVVTFTVKDAVAESVTYTARDVSSGLTVTQTATVTFVGTVSASLSTVLASPTSVPANNTATSTITVTLKDGAGNPVPGKTVTLTAGSGSSTVSPASGVSSAGGVVTFTVKDAVVEPVTYTARDATDNLTLTQTASVGFTATSAAIYYIHTDHLNTPRTITNGAGLAVWKWDNNEPFGASVPDQNPAGLGAFEFNQRFPGQYFDKETNLHYNMARDYDPSIGRYVESDPIGLKGGVNTYAYVKNNPLSSVDPLGLCACAGGTWNQSAGDWQVSVALGGYISVGRVNFTCNSNPSLQCTAKQVCIGGGPIATLGLTFNVIGDVGGAGDSRQLGGWSDPSVVTSIGPVSITGGTGGGGNVAAGPSLGAGVALYVRCYTKELKCNCPCEGK